MKFLRVKDCLAECKQHLTSQNAFNTPIENYLVSHLLIITYRSFEVVFRELIRLRVQKANDPHLERFTMSRFEKVGKILIGDINSNLKNFDETCSRRFMDSIENRPSHAAWDNVITNRHKVGHGSGSQMTLEEFERAFERSCEVLHEFGRSLGLTNEDFEKCNEG